MNRPHRDTVRELHESHSSQDLECVVANFALLGLWCLAGWTWFAGLWPLTIVVWVITAHHSHCQLMRFHEASHGLLSANETLNELRGMFIGVFCLVPLSAYRVAHHAHHSYLATKRDGELWPFTDPQASRPFRLVMMVAELAFGYFVKPLLFLRVVLVERLSSKQRRRIVLEYALCITFWTLVLVTVARNGWWEALAVCYLIPAWMAGCFQSFRLYTEHMGLLGSTPLSLSRTVVPKGVFSRIISRTMLYSDSHGTHHQFATVPHDRITEATAHIYGAEEYGPKTPVFDSYWHAFCDMVPSLADPKVGSQWLTEQPAESAAREEKSRQANAPTNRAPISIA